MIKNITINNFRAVIGKQVIHINEKSALIIGDNGTGKSSIVDAVEFVLQGRINKSQLFNRENIPIPHSLMSDDSDSYVSININQNEHYRPVRVQKEELLSSKLPYKGFSIAPFVIRRSDIVNFWNTPIKDRQLVLLDFFKINDDFNWDSEMMKITDLENKRVELKNERRKIRGEIASLFDKKTSEVPVNHQEVINFSKNLPKDLHEKNEHIIKNMIRIAKEVIEIDGKLLKAQYEVRNSEHLNKIKNILSSLSSEISSSFLHLSPNRDMISKIDINISDHTNSSLEFILILKNGKKVMPNKLLSEANLDLLALIIFTEFIKQASQMGQEKLIIFDDIFQSIDNTLRYQVMHFYLQQLKKWQIIFTVHDRLWKEQVKELFRFNNFELEEIEIISWDQIHGPKFEMIDNDLDKVLERRLEDGILHEICGLSGILLEKICNELSYNLPLNITRKRGDKYTLGDIWPSAFKALSKTTLLNTVKKIDTIISLRNLVGAHYNSWALSLSKQEATDLGRGVLELYRKVFCKECYRWTEEVKIGNAGSGKWSCRKEHIGFEKLDPKTPSNKE